MTPHQDSAGERGTFEYTAYVVARLGEDDDIESTKSRWLGETLSSKSEEFEQGACVIRDEIPQEIHEWAAKIFGNRPEFYVVILLKVSRAGGGYGAGATSQFCLPGDLDIELGDLNTPIEQVIKGCFERIDARIKRDRHDKMMADRKRHAEEYRAELKKKESERPRS